MAVLGSTNLTGCNSIPDFIAAGSLMLFQQTSAPTGWTKQTTHDNKALRVVIGTASSGGSVNFTSTFSSSRSGIGSVEAHTLTTAQIPSHTHNITNVCTFFGPVQDPGGFGDSHANTPNKATQGTGGGGSHTHPFTFTPMDFEVQYVDLIICSKNA